MGSWASGFGGFVFGVVLAAGYVHYGAELPGWLTLPDRLKGNLISTAVDDQLYDLSAAPEAQRRALEVYFDNRAKDAATLDAAVGHPFLTALRQARAGREARELIAMWGGFDAALAQPALKEALTRRHGTADVSVLKAAMLDDALAKRPFLTAWLARQGATNSAGPLIERLRPFAALR